MFGELSLNSLEKFARWHLSLFLKVLKFSASAVSFGRLFHLSIMLIKKECLKLFKVEDAILSLKQWLAL